MSVATNLLVTKALVAAVDFTSPDVIRKLDVHINGKKVNSKSLIARYARNMITKRKTVITYEREFWNTVTSLPAETFQVSVYTLGGTALLGQLHSGSLSIATTGPDVSSAGASDELPIPTGTDMTLSTKLFVVTEANFTSQMLSSTSALGLQVTVVVTFCSQTFSFPGTLTATSHTIDVGEAQLEDVTIDLQGTPTGAGAAGTDAYIAVLGTGVAVVDFDTGVNEYKSGSGSPVNCMVGKIDVQWVRDGLISISGTLEAQGILALVAGG